MEEFKLTKNQQKETASRVLSDAELINKGAEYTKEGRLDVPSQAVEGIIRDEVFKNGVEELLSTYIERQFDKEKNINKIAEEIYYMSNLVGPTRSRAYNGERQFNFSFPIESIIQAIPQNLKSKLQKIFENKANESEKRGYLEEAAEYFKLAGDDDKFRNLYLKEAKRLEKEGTFLSYSGPISGPTAGASEYYLRLGDKDKVQEMKARAKKAQNI